MVKFNNRGLVNILILVGLGAAVIVLAVLVAGNLSNKTPVQLISPPKSSTYSPSPTNQQLKTFQSKFMKFSVELPNNFSAIDEPSRITIQSNRGQIYVNRNGTQFNDLGAYLTNFDQTTQLEISLDEKMTINDYETRKRITKNPDIGTEKTYFLYIENFVYKISTSFESLYDDLDQIAQSFRHTP